MGREAAELRYLELKNVLCEKIYEGVYQSGERIPSERQLAEEYGMSRITVRKALELLEEDDLIVREVGNGTKVTLKNYGNRNPLDVIALVAPSKNPFFVRFIAEFQKCAWEHDTLLLYVEVPEPTSLEDCLYRLYRKDIRNVVVWPDDQSIDREKLLRLRSIGMNLVFFDTDVAHPFADSVFLDNEDAVETLLRAGDTFVDYMYVGWDNLYVSNIRKREEAYRRIHPEGKVENVPWRRDRRIEREALERIKELAETMEHGFILCGAGEIGMQVLEFLADQNEFAPSGKQSKVTLAVIDEFEGARKYSFFLYNQDLQASAEKIFECLKCQMEEGAKWKAKICPVKGQFKKISSGE